MDDITFFFLVFNIIAYLKLSYTPLGRLEQFTLVDSYAQ